MSRRRDNLRALFAGGDDTAADAAAAVEAPETKALVPRDLVPRTQIPNPVPVGRDAPAHSLPRAGSGALKAMGLELDGLRSAAAAAETMKAAIAGGDRVLSLDAALIDEGFVRDRMAGSGGVEEALEASIRESGQQVPVLLRPNPRAPGRFETVYGHRRIAALRRLGLPVRAVVRELDDEAFVVAQGQENNARLDLSFIERARFAALLSERGFTRATIMAALAVHSADVTRYLSVCEAIDSWLIEAIGPAPKVGRARWMKLASRLAGAASPRALAALVETPAYRALSSDKRFAAVFAALRSPSVDAAEPVFASGDGRLSVRRSVVGKEIRLGFTGEDGAALARFVESRLAELYSGLRPETKGS
jgi:ParB family chromosome partitioning protein